jgi:hypothetical protein
VIGRASGLVLLAAGVAGPVAAQGYRLRLDSRYQSVSFRGVRADSILAADAVTRPGQGYFTTDGFAVSCAEGAVYCYFLRPGDKLRGNPVSGTGDLTLWGFGVTGLTFHASARFARDLSSQVDYPLTEPAVTLLEGYLDYNSRHVVGRAGRQIVTGRLGYQGFDGALGTLRDPARGVEVTGYAGWGLARGTALPVTSPALNPLDDFQPRSRQLLFGAELGVQHAWVDFRADYRREIDPVPDYLVSERASASLSLSPFPGWRLTGGGDYDFANGWWGSADATLGYAGKRFYATATARRYRPFFDLWTIWGAFSPVPYHAVSGAAAVQAVEHLWVRASGERYWFEATEASTALVSVEDRGWRGSVGASLTLADRWTVDAGVRGEFGPGAASRTVEGSVTWQARDGVSLSAQAATLARPLEFRYDQSNLDWYSVGADVRLNGQWRWVSDLAWVSENRARPDAAAIDWGQFRASTRIVLTLGSSADRLALPPGRPRPKGATP